jgi:hypothetical protein
MTCGGYPSVGDPQLTGQGCCPDGSGNSWRANANTRGPGVWPMTQGSTWYSCNGRYALTLTGGTGDLVLVDVDSPTGPAAIWDVQAMGDSGTGCDVALQGDGDFVEDDCSMSALFTSATSGHPVDYISLQNDGDLAIYDPDGTLLWHTGTAGE